VTATSTLTPSSTPTPTATAAPTPTGTPLPPPPGDADCDNDVDLYDVAAVLKDAAALAPAPCGHKANVYCEDGLNAYDGLLILDLITGIPVQVPTAPASLCG
jgi:hypothetical protein